MVSGEKRQFPYYSTVPSLEVKRRGVEGFNPGQAQAEPAVHSFPYLQNDPSVKLLSTLRSPHSTCACALWVADMPHMLLGSPPRPTLQSGRIPRSRASLIREEKTMTTAKVLPSWYELRGFQEGKVFR